MPVFTKMNSDLCAAYLETENPSKGFELHYHSVYELYYFVDGDADYQVEGRQYHLKPNSLILLAPYVLHGVRINSRQTYKRYSIHFDMDRISLELRPILLAPFPGKESISKEEVYYTDLQDFNLPPFLQALVRSQTSGSSLFAKLEQVYLEAILSELTFMRTQKHPVENTYTLSKPIPEVIDYINKHFSEKITLDTLSKHFFLNKDYLNRLFKKNIGITVALYITHKRIGYAQHLLETGMSASVVARTVGFDDYSSFYRAYKKITGSSPRNRQKTGGFVSPV